MGGGFIKKTAILRLEVHHILQPTRFWALGDGSRKAVRLDVKEHLSRSG
jgi:hypothetical protein